MPTSCNVTGQPYVNSTYKIARNGPTLFYQVSVPVAFKAYDAHNRRVSRATLHAIAHQYACDFCESDESIAERYAASLSIGEQVDCWYNHKQPTAVRLSADLHFGYMLILWARFVGSLVLSVGAVVGSYKIWCVPNERNESGTRMGAHRQGVTMSSLNEPDLTFTDRLLLPRTLTACAAPRPAASAAC